MSMTSTPNPVLRSTQLRAYPGWFVREYADGTFVAVHTGGACSPVEFTFNHAVHFARHDEPVSYGAGQRDEFLEAYRQRNGREFS